MRHPDQGKGKENAGSEDPQEPTPKPLPKTLKGVLKQKGPLDAAFVVGEVGKLSPKDKLYWFWELFCRSLKRYDIGVETEEAGKLCDRFNVPWRQPTKITASTHPISRTCRLVAERLALTKMFHIIRDGGSKGRVIDFYGSDRNLVIYTKMIGEAAKLTGVQPIDFTWYRPLLTPKDVTSYSNTLAKHPSIQPQKGDYLLMTDLYNESPQQMVQHFLDSEAKEAMIVVQIFPRTAVAGMRFGESVYYAQNGRVHQAPAPGDHEWIPAPSNDYWLRHKFLTCTQSGATASWDVWRRVEDYYIINMVRTEGLELVPTPSMVVTLSSNDLLEYRQIPRPGGIVQRCYHWLPECVRGESIYDRDLLVFLPAVTKLATTMTLKTRQSYQLSSVTAQVHSLMQAEQYAEFWRSIPRSYSASTVASDTAAYLMWATLEEETTLFQQATHAFGSTVAKLKAARTAVNSPDPTPPRVEPALMMVLAAFLLILLRLKIRRAYGAWELPTWVFGAAMRSVQQWTGGIAFGVEKALELVDVLPLLPTLAEVPRAARTLVSHVSFTPVNVPCFLANISLFSGLSADRVILALLAPFYEEWIKARLPYGPELWAILEAAPAFMVSTRFGLSSLIHKVILHKSLTMSQNPILNHALYNAAAGATALMDVIVGTQPLDGPAQEMNRSMFWGSLLSGIIALSRQQNRVSLAETYGVISLGVASHFAVTSALMAHVTSSYPVPPVPSGDSVFGLLNVFPLLLSAFAATETKPSEQGSAEQFLAEYAEARHTDTDFEAPIGLSLTQAKLPSLRLNGSIVNYPGPSDFYSTRDPTTHVFVLLGTTQMMVRPQGFYQFWYAYQQRNLCEVPITAECEGLEYPPCVFSRGTFKYDPVVVAARPVPCPYHVRWKHVTKMMLDLMQLSPSFVDAPRMKRQEWIARFGSAMKKARARQAVAERADGDVMLRSGAFLKGDEVLYPRVGEDGMVKGRLVKAVSPFVQADAGVHIALAMKLLKDIFNEERPHRVGDWEFTATVGSGKLASELDTWLEVSLSWVSGNSKRLAFIVAGDDFFGILNLDGKLVFIENDFTKFDRTQGVHALDFEFAVLLWLGVPLGALSRLFASIFSTAVYEEKYLEMKMALPMPAQRATGGPNTTIGNTVNNIGSVVYSLKRVNKTGVFDLSRFQAELGFVAKVSTHQRFGSATFLKGWWMPTKTGGAVWLPLPSQVIKLGKILTDPRTIYKHLAPEDAWRASAKAMAASYRLVPREYPLFGPFLARYDALLESEVGAAELEEHKVFVDRAAALDVEGVRDLVEERYELSWEDQRAMEVEIFSTPFPGLMVHPGWRAVVRRDYG